MLRADVFGLLVAEFCDGGHFVHARKRGLRQGGAGEKFFKNVFSKQVLTF